MIEILFIVFWVAGLIFLRTPWAGSWPWAPHAYYMLMFALVGLALFDGLGRISVRP